MTKYLIEINTDERTLEVFKDELKMDVIDISAYSEDSDFGFGIEITKKEDDGPRN